MLKQFCKPSGAPVLIVIWNTIVHEPFGVYVWYIVLIAVGGAGGFVTDTQVYIFSSSWLPQYGPWCSVR